MTQHDLQDALDDTLSWVIKINDNIIGLNNSVSTLLRQWSKSDPDTQSKYDSFIKSLTDVTQSLNDMVQDNKIGRQHDRNELENEPNNTPSMKQTLTLNKDSLIKLIVDFLQSEYVYLSDLKTMEPILSHMSNIRSTIIKDSLSILSRIISITDKFYRSSSSYANYLQETETPEYDLKFMCEFFENVAKEYRLYWEHSSLFEKEIGTIDNIETLDSDITSATSGKIKTFFESLSLPYDRYEFYKSVALDLLDILPDESNEYTRINSFLSSPIDYFSDENTEQLYDSRTKIMLELYTTEKRYIKDLEILKEAVMEPIKESGVIPSGEFDLIFSNIYELKTLNEERLCSPLESRINVIRDRKKPIGMTKIGDLTAAFAKSLKSYKIYCINQTGQMGLLDELEDENIEFVNFVRQCVSDPRFRGLGLKDWLVKPLQRLTKYPLLLRELQKFTPEDDEDFNLLADAIEKVTKAVTHVNKRKARAEAVAEEEKQALIQVNNTFESTDANGNVVNFVKYGRKLEDRSLVESITGKKNNKSTHVFLFLFSDILCVSTEHRGKFKLERIHLYKNLKVTDVGDLNKLTNGFELTDKEDDFTWKLSFSDVEKKREFLQKIKKKIREYQIQTVARFMYRQNSSNNISQFKQSSSDAQDKDSIRRTKKKSRMRISTNSREDTI
eukprot:TRINITY_DN642_c0_g1_i1.p1 TRINITY_DN642_c0_g1~~TRINITY_DN642_c0_g1_i1.p1  ORF type:complete len:671 (+),score=89.37 TRINITY_DN642_c0_g1_i1:710-2722(+)